MNPLTVIGTVVGTVSGWMVDDTMVLGARAGASLGPSIYSELDPRMTTMPRNLMVAYEQALYFVALGARRAMRDGNPASTALLRTLDRLQAEGAAVSAQVTWICSTTGVMCPSGGAGAVLQEAIDAIESSGLGSDDVVQVTAHLRSNKRWFQIRQAAPFVVGSLVLVGGVWWWQRRSKL